MENENIRDPYEAVIADLRAQRQKIDQTIELLESLRGGASAGSASAAGQASESTPSAQIGPGAFLGMSIPDASKKLLSSLRRPLRTTEIAPELERGGLHLTSTDKVNTIGSVLRRRFEKVGDIVPVQRGVWGLAEWYPGRRFNKGPAKAEESGKPEETGNEETQSDIASENVSGTPNEQTGEQAIAATSNPFQLKGLADG